MGNSEHGLSAGPRSLKVIKVAAAVPVQRKEPKLVKGRGTGLLNQWQKRKQRFNGGVLVHEDRFDLRGSAGKGKRSQFLPYFWGGVGPDLLGKSVQAAPGNAAVEQLGSGTPQHMEGGVKKRLF